MCVTCAHVYGNLLSEAQYHVLLRIRELRSEYYIKYVVSNKGVKKREREREINIYYSHCVNEKEECAITVSVVEDYYYYYYFIIIFIIMLIYEILYISSLYQCYCE